MGGCRGKCEGFEGCEKCRMATIKRFEEIVAWQEARKLAKMVYAVTREGAFAKDGSSCMTVGVRSLHNLI